MGTRAGWWLSRWLVVVVALLVSAPAGAQPRDLGLRPDSLGIPADTVPLPVERVDVACDPMGLRVVRDTADLRAIERFPGCEAAEFPALGRDLYVHLVMGGNCGGRDRVDAYRSAARREYRLVLVAYHYGCRGLRGEEYWVRLPPLPEGWTVGFTVIPRGRPEEPARTDPASAMPMLADAPAVAHPGSGGLRADPRGIAADAEPLPIHAEWSVECDPPGVRVLRDSADARGISDLPGCQRSAFPALGRALYVRLVPGFCGGRFTLQAYRSEARREYRVVTIARSRGCGGRGDGPRWYRLPPLPAGWTVAFTETAA